MFFAVVCSSETENFEEFCVVDFVGMVGYIVLLTSKGSCYSPTNIAMLIPRDIISSQTHSLTPTTSGVTGKSP